MNKVERKVYKVGAYYGYMAYMDIETKKVLVVMYDTPHEGGVIYSSPDGIEEVTNEALEYLKERDIRVYTRIMNIKNGIEDFVRYAWYDVQNNRFATISGEKWEHDNKSNALTAEYIARGYELRPYPLKDYPHEAKTFTFPI